MTIDPSELEKAFRIVEAYGYGRLDSYKEAMKIFRRIAEELPVKTLEEMQAEFYGILDDAKVYLYPDEQRTMSGIKAVMSAAWDGVGEWRD